MKNDQLIWLIKTISVGHFFLAFEQWTPSAFIHQYQFISTKTLAQFALNLVSLTDVVYNSIVRRLVLVKHRDDIIIYVIRLVLGACDKVHRRIIYLRAAHMLQPIIIDNLVGFRNEKPFVYGTRHRNHKLPTQLTVVLSYS